MRATYSEIAPVYTPSINPTNVSGLRRYNIAGVDTFVACITTASATYIGFSIDGVNWSVNITPLANLTDVAYDGALFVAVSADLNYATSPDGIVWTSRTFPSISGSNFPSVIGHNGTRFLVLSQIGSGAWYSTSGTSWTTFSHGLGGHCYHMMRIGTTLVISRAEAEACLYSLDGTAVALQTGATTNGQIVRDGAALYSPVSNTESVDGVAWVVSSRTALSLGFNSTAARAPENTSPLDSLVLAVHSVVSNTMDIWAYDAIGSRDHVLDFGTYTASGLTPLSAPIAWVDNALVIVNAWPYPIARFEFQATTWASFGIPDVDGSALYAPAICWTGLHWVIGGYDSAGFLSIGTAAMDDFVTIVPDPVDVYGFTALCARPDGLVVAITDCADGVGSYVSHDYGATWQVGGLVFATGYCESVVWNGAMFVAADWNNVAIAVSVNGLEWTPATPYLGVGPYGQLVAGFGYTFAFEKNEASQFYGYYTRSADGLVWTQHTYEGTTLSNIRVSCAACNGRVMVVLPRAGGTKMYRTVNGDDWTEHDIPDRAWIAVAWNGKYFCATTDESTDQCFLSVDGKEWFEGPFLSLPAHWYALAGGNGQFLAVNYDNRTAVFSPAAINQTFWTGFINCEEAA